MVKEEYCPTVSAFRTHKVAKQKPVPVSIYDYYDSCKYKAQNFNDSKKIERVLQHVFPARSEKSKSVLRGQKDNLVRSVRG